MTVNIGIRASWQTIYILYCFHLHYRTTQSECDLPELASCLLAFSPIALSGYEILQSRKVASEISACMTLFTVLVSGQAKVRDCLRLQVTTASQVFKWIVLLGSLFLLKLWQD